MSYLVLARKYRPQNFDEVIGQEHISHLLKNAIQSGRSAHAYLFCGPRGIGKTSCARILAKSLNCEQGPTLKPCEKCSACLEITKGISFDVLEIDGASNRGIDEIRTLRENVKFAPSYGRFKIYIVDEVHMLTTEAFNALLKTLEEPPAHVKFVFATTVPNKVPATIISRCQRFDFRRIPIKTIVKAIAAISKKEKFKIDQEALFAIGKAAQGSLRDALSILDQLSAISDRDIGAEDVFSMLGLVETQLLFELTDALGQKNCSLSLEVLEKILDKGKDIRQLVRDITEHFRNLMIIKIGGKALGRMVDYPVAVKEMLLVQCQQFTLKEILAAIDTFIEAQETSRITESMRMPLEVAFAKFTYQDQPLKAAETQSPMDTARPRQKSSDPLVRTAGVTGESELPAKSPQKASVFLPVNVLKNQKGHLDISGHEGEPEEDTEEFEISDSNESALEIANDMDILVSAGTLDCEKIKRCWDALTHAISREKMSVATYLHESTPVEYKDGNLIIGFPKKCAFQKEALESQNNIKLVQRIFSEKFKMPIVIQYKIIDDYVPKEEEPQIKSVLNTFEGKVVNRWYNE